MSNLRDTLDKKRMAGSVMLGNAVPWLKDDRIINALMETRRKDLMGKAGARLSGIMNKHSAKRGA